MPQICPSQSRQLAAASIAFQHARQKFPKHLGLCSCSRDVYKTPLEAYPMIKKTVIAATKEDLVDSRLEYNATTDCSYSSRPPGKKNYKCFPTVSSSRTASWSNGYLVCEREQKINATNSELRHKSLCATCGKRDHCPWSKGRVQDVPKVIVAASGSIVSKTPRSKIAASVRVVDSRESNQMFDHISRKPLRDQKTHETTSKSTHSSAGRRKRRRTRHRRSCVYSGIRVRTPGSRSPPKIQECSMTCQFHRFSSASRRQSSIPQKLQNSKYCHREISAKGKEQRSDEPEKSYYSDSPTLVDFPTKLQIWEHRTQQNSHRESRNSKSTEKRSHQGASLQKDAHYQLKKETNQEQTEHFQLNDDRDLNYQEKHIAADVCLRPSVVKAAQCKIELRSKPEIKSYSTGSHLSKNSDMKSTWEENLNIINHKDSMSILMDKFKKKNKQCSLKLQNIHELNSVLGSKTSCGDGEPHQLDDITKVRQLSDAVTNQSLQPFGNIESKDRFRLRTSLSVINPVTKLGRVANQAFKEYEPHFHTRLNNAKRSCSPKSTQWGPAS